MGEFEVLTERIRILEKEVRELRSKEAVLRKLAAAVENSPISVMITDSTGTIEYVNPKFCEVTGYTAPEVIGKNPRILKGGSQSDDFYRELWETILSGREWHGEFHNRNKNGSLLWELASISPIRDGLGRVTHFVGVKEDISELKRLQQELGQMAHSDDLTGLPNRALFIDRLEQVMIHAHRNRSKFALLFIDLDGFKLVNDTYGHKTGDDLLKSVALRLTSCVREADTVARVGGDEFVVILKEDLKRLEEPGIVAEKMLKAFSMPFNIDGNICNIGLSIGISIYPDDAEDAQQLIICADEAMYQVKQRGKNHFKYSSDCW